MFSTKEYSIIQFKAYFEAVCERRCPMWMSCSAKLNVFLEQLSEIYCNTESRCPEQQTDTRLIAFDLLSVTPQVVLLPVILLPLGRNHQPTALLTAPPLPSPGVSFSAMLSFNTLTLCLHNQVSWYKTGEWMRLPIWAHWIPFVLSFHLVYTVICISCHFKMSTLQCLDINDIDYMPFNAL